MREHKYRVWSFKYKEFWYFKLGERFEWKENEKPDEFTGLKDKNGKEIYEGDILEYEYNLDTRHTRKFRDAMEWEICGNWSGFNFNKEMIYEVIGNIYENPELLK